MKQFYGACDCEYRNTICCSSYECVTPGRTPTVTTITPTETIVVCSGGSRPDGNGGCYCYGGSIPDENGSCFCAGGTKPDGNDGWYYVVDTCETIFGACDCENWKFILL